MWSWEIGGAVLLPFLCLGKPMEHEVTFCQFDDVNATCRPGNVVIMEAAKYGRMEINHCVTRNYGGLGCQADVMSTLDGWCSGVRGCAFKVPRLLENVPSPCPIDLTSSLTLRYRCLPVDNARECDGSRSLTLNNTSGFISSYYGFQNNVGTHACPVFLQASPGQRINLTLFTYIEEEERLSVRHENSRCSYHLNIIDGESMYSIGLCDETSPRHVFNSTSNSVRLHFTGRFGTSRRYIVQYTVTGCPDLRPPPGSIFVPQGPGQGVVRCRHTSQQWVVSCLGTAWLGKIGNCSPPKGRTEPPKEEQKPFSISVLIAILCGLFLGIIIGIFLLIVVCVWRKRHVIARKRRRNQNKLLNDEPPTYDQRHAYSPHIVPRAHACQSTHCDGRCVAPTTYCGRATIYTRGGSGSPAPQDMALKERVPPTGGVCQYHTLNPSMMKSNTITKAVPQQCDTAMDYNEMTSSLLPVSNTLQLNKKTTAFSTFKPPPSGNESNSDVLDNKYGTNLNNSNTLKGILRNGGGGTSDDNCTCQPAVHGVSTMGTGNRAPIVAATANDSQGGVATQPDVILSNKENERLQLTYSNTRSMSNPDDLLSRSYSQRSTEQLSQF